MGTLKQNGDLLGTPKLTLIFDKLTKTCAFYKILFNPSLSIKISILSISFFFIKNPNNTPVSTTLKRKRVNEKSPIHELLEDLVVFLAKESTGASEEENSAIFSLF